MKRYEFGRSVVVDGTPYQAGDRVTEGDIPAGYFESCVRVGHLGEIPATPDPAEAFAAAMEARPPAADPIARGILVSDVPTPPPEPLALTVGPPAAPEPEPEPKADPKHDHRDKRKK